MGTMLALLAFLFPPGAAARRLDTQPPVSVACGALARPLVLGGALHVGRSARTDPSAAPFLRGRQVSVRNPVTPAAGPAPQLPALGLGFDVLRGTAEKR